MKRLIAKSLMLASGLTLSSQLMALGLGEMTLKSALNQPLKAEVDLVDADDLSKWEIKPSLASTEDFDRAGVDRVFFLTKIKFKVEDNKVILTTREPVTEPFLNFLVELNWPSGRVLREYTVLLDPPVFEEEAYTPLVVTPRNSESTASVVSRETQGAEVNRGHDWLDRPAKPGTYKVQPNDTLWEIALESRPDSSVSAQQMMLAIQAQNPDAFIGGNINRLKTHQVLRIPSAEDVENIRFGQAVAEVQRQNDVLSTGSAQLDATGRRKETAVENVSDTGGEVRLLSADSDNAESAGASGDVQGQGNGRQQALENDLAIALETLDKSRLENQELRQRLEALEEQINTLQRLITLKDDQLAGIQVNSAQQQTAETDAAAPQAEENESAVVGSQADIAEAGASESEAVVAGTEASDQSSEASTAADAKLAQSSQSETVVPDAQPKPVSEAQSQAGSEVDFNYESEAKSEPVADTAVDTAATDAAKKAEQEARRKRIQAMIEAQNRPEPSFIDSLLQRPEFLGGGLAALLLMVLGALKLVQRRKSAKEDAEVTEESEVKFADGDLDNADLDDIDFDDGDLQATDLDIDSGELDAQSSDDLDIGELDEDSDSDFGGVAQTEDAISESDIYIAYGKFEQAVDLLSSAIEHEPSRSDLRLKLLEVYVEMDEAELFAQQEASLIAIGDRDANDQAEQLRSRLSSPLAPSADGDTSESGLSLDSDDIPALDDSLGDEFSNGLDFGDALDMAESDEVSELAGESGSDTDTIAELTDDSDSLDFDLGGSVDDADSISIDAVEDVPALDEEASLEDVPTLDLDDGDSLEFDLTGDSAELDLDGADDADPTSVAELEGAADGDNTLEFDLGDLDVTSAESVEPMGEAAVAAEDVSEFEGDDLEFDLGELSAIEEASDVDDLLADLDVAAEDDISLELGDDINVGSEFDLDGELTPEASEILEDDTESEDIIAELDAAEPVQEDDDVELLDLSAEIAVDDSADELADLENLLDAEGSVGDSELPELSFDMDGDTGFATSADEDLKELEAELDSAVEGVERFDSVEVDAEEADTDSIIDLGTGDEAEIEDLVDTDEVLPIVNDDAVDVESGAEVTLDDETDSDFDAVEEQLPSLDDLADTDFGVDLDDDGAMDFASDLADLDAELDDFDLGDDLDDVEDATVIDAADTTPVLDESESAIEDLDIPVIAEQETPADGMDVPEVDESQAAIADELDIPVIEETEIPVIDEQDIPVVDDSASSETEVSAEQNIDLDQLASAEDEFDFLAGTDECATKLDLARAYIDMEDMDGARELLQEVLQEGSDQQKQDARGLMDNLS